MVLTPEQIFFLGFLATLITTVLNVVFKFFGKSVGRGVLSVILFFISLGLAVLWNGPVILPPFPPFTDVISFVGAILVYFASLLSLVGPLVAFATLIYNVLYEKVVVPAIIFVIDNIPTRH